MATTNILLFRNPSSVLYNILISSPRLVCFGSNPKKSLFISIYLVHTTCSIHKNLFPSSSGDIEDNLKNNYKKLRPIHIAIIRLQPISTVLMLYYLNLVEIQDINKQLKNKSGIYGFLCRTTNKIYIGSSINLYRRFNRHFNGDSSNIKLQRAINKYTLQNFIFIVFEFCEAKDLIIREQYYFHNLKPEYNINPVAGSRLGSSQSIETRAKMSKIMSGENNPRGMLGKSHLDETKALISKTLSGNKNPRFGKTPSAETKLKMREAKLKRVFIYYKNAVSNELILFKSFDSCTEVTIYFKCSKSTIYTYLDKDRLYKKQWILSTSEK